MEKGKILKLVLSLLTLHFSISSYVHSSPSVDFDRVCGYFQELEKLKNIDALTHLQRNDFILEKLKNISANNNGRVAWEAIASANASQRYEIFKDTAESILKKKWDCPSMKKLAPVTGYFK